MESQYMLDLALRRIAEFFDACKVGYEGNEGYRKSTDLFKFIHCIRELRSLGHISPDRTVFMDLGCADGRVNVLMSYFTKRSIGIEIDTDILAEFEGRKKALYPLLDAEGLPLPPDNISLFAGSSLDEETYRRIRERAGIRFTDVDLFYTYITLHDVFAEKIASQARPGALYLVYGFNRVLPRYDGMDLIEPDLARQGIAALYAKKD